MSKIVLFNMMTVNGLFAGKNGEIDWHHVDAEFNDFAVTQLNSAAGLIFGRATYEGMASYWPTRSALEDDPTVARKMNEISKIVFSRTLAKAEWNNTRLIKNNVNEEFEKLRRDGDRDWLIFGSANLAETFIKNDAIDEYRIMVNPVVIGAGKPLFQAVQDRIDLKLIRTRPFQNGNVLLAYQPIRR